MRRGRIPISAVIVGYCEALNTFQQRGYKRDDLLRGLRIVGFERRVTIAFVVGKSEILIGGIFYAGRTVEAAFQELD